MIYQVSGASHSGVIPTTSLRRATGIEKTQLSFGGTGYSSTPLPQELSAGFSMTSQTGWLRDEEPRSAEADGIAELIHSAARYIQDVSVIEIDPEHDRFVERFIREELGESDRTVPLKLKK